MQESEMPLRYQRYLCSVTTFTTYMGCPTSIRRFWISQRPVAWPWCNLAASQKRPYCASMNSHSPMGLVNRQWDAIERACVLCDLHSKWIGEQISFITSMCLPILQLSCRLFLAKHYTTQVCQPPYSPDLAPCNFWFFPELKIPIEREVIRECDGHKVHKLSQQRLTAEWLAPRDSDCSRMRSKVSSEWLPITSRPRDQFSRYSKWMDTFRTALIYATS